MPNPEKLEDTAKELTTKAEKGESVTEELNKIPIAERVQIAHMMEANNKENIAQGLTKVEIKGEYLKDAGGTEHLMDMKRIADPNAWVFKGKSDIYDMVKPANEGLTSWTDGLAMAADTQYDKKLQSPDMYTSAWDK